MDEMNEAFSVLDEHVNSGAIQLSPEKVPEGATIVGIELDRDPARSGQFMTSISKAKDESGNEIGWQPVGKIVAIREGHFLAGNFLFGCWAKGQPKIGPCHRIRCKNCGKDIIMPLAVWQAKDGARKAAKLSKEELDKMSGFDILRKFGHCSCGGVWAEDPEFEKRALLEFTARVLDDVSVMDKPVPSFVAPKAFTIHPVAEKVSLGDDWEWVNKALSSGGNCAIPFEQNGRGDTIMFNPGYWFGLCSDPDSTGLFFKESPETRAWRMRRAFNPCGVDGL